MALLRTRTLDPRAALAADGGLMTAGAWSAVVIVAWMLESVVGAPDVAVARGMIAATGLGPFIAWWLRRRGVDGAAVAGALVGYLTGGAVLIALVALTGIVGRTAASVGLFANAEDAGKVVGPIAGVATAIAYLVVAAWLNGNALGDLLSGRREHVWLDVARVLTTAAYAACSGNRDLLGGGDIRRRPCWTGPTTCESRRHRGGGCDGR